jgi:hypothetical protein
VLTRLVFTSYDAELSALSTDTVVGGLGYAGVGQTRVMNAQPSSFLGPEAPGPVDRPFTRAQARAWRVADRRLAAWVADGLLQHPLKGVFYASQMPDGLELRLECLRLIVPESAVVTGRTAGWVYRAPMVLAPGDHLRVPPVEMHLSPGNRLRNPISTGGERTFRPGEVVELEGLRITSKLRTTVDLGMGLPRRQAFAGMCAMSQVADFDREELRFEIRERGRFAGYRGVCQARELEPGIDPRFGSAAECALALEWKDVGGLPDFVPQHPVQGPKGMFYLDLAVPALKYAGEYNGARWHDDDRAAYDAGRMAWLVEHEDWIIDVFESDDLYGPGRDPGLRLKLGIQRARRRFGSLAWTGQNRDGESWVG